MNWLLIIPIMLSLIIIILAIAQFAKTSKLQKICKIIAIEFTQIFLFRFRKGSEQDAQECFKR
ncbi:MAG: hypothetical protein PF542_00615 [Nanoarchaeota archaeon]|nr:hypothetical protein [Nanoarchaeota archaeon]